ncbi:hypothetical protein C2845_PM06G06880 [Panicum miliaceum]|uniref:AIG1-type G domain-containing protein n=1 Tax=Panicum miliaceum TaxID=4540 RepID=A0A3L6RD50_PANMI|nr:hypothetical protein C2845_PM06G06880 [Panicum miliaceum]
MAATTDNTLVAFVEEQNPASAVAKEEPPKKAELAVATANEAASLAPLVDENLAPMEKEASKKVEMLAAAEEGKEAFKKVMVNEEDKEMKGVGLEGKGRSFTGLKVVNSEAEGDTGGDNCGEVEKAEEDSKGGSLGATEAMNDDVSEVPAMQDTKLVASTLEPAPTPMVQSKLENGELEEEDASLASPDVLESVKGGELQEEQHKKEQVGVGVEAKVVDKIGDDTEFVVAKVKPEPEGEKVKEVGSRGADGGKLGEKEATDDTMVVGGEEGSEGSMEKDVHVPTSEASTVIVNDGRIVEFALESADNVLENIPRIEQNAEGQATANEVVEDVGVDKNTMVENIADVVEEGIDIKKHIEDMKNDVGGELEAQKMKVVISMVEPTPMPSVESKSEDYELREEDASIASHEALEGEERVQLWEEVGAIVQAKVADDAGNAMAEDEKLKPECKKLEEVGFGDENGRKLGKQKEVEVSIVSIEAADLEDKLASLTEANRELSYQKESTNHIISMGGEEAMEELIQKDVDVPTSEMHKEVENVAVVVEVVDIEKHKEAVKDDVSREPVVQDTCAIVPMVEPVPIPGMESNLENSELGEADASLASPNAPKGDKRGELWEDEEVGVVAVELEDKLAPFAEANTELGYQKQASDDTVAVGGEALKESTEKVVDVPMSEARSVVVNDGCIEKAALESTNSVLEDSLGIEQYAEGQATASEVVEGVGVEKPLEVENVVVVVEDADVKKYAEAEHVAAVHAQSNLFSSAELAVTADPIEEMTEEEKNLHDKVELIQVKFLRLVYRLGATFEETVTSQVLYRLSLVEGIMHMHGRQTNQDFSLDNARKKAFILEAEGKEDLNFTCNILVLGKTGVGKSATINSIFGEDKSKTDAFSLATTSVQEYFGDVHGIKIRIIDTPGFQASVMDQGSNRKILTAIKKYTKKCSPDIIVYVDRLDSLSHDFNDLPLLKTITSVLGSSVWFNAIVALTHAASAPPEGLNGAPVTYEVLMAQRSHIIHQSIRQAAGDMRLMNPIALVENHPSCRRNHEGHKVLPNGQSWRHQMLLLFYSSKILSEDNSLLKSQDPNPREIFGFHFQPLPFMLSSLLQSRAHPKLSVEQGGNEGDFHIELDDYSNVQQDGDEEKHDQLLPFKPLTKAHLARVTRKQKKQWKDEICKLKEMKKRGETDLDDYGYANIADNVSVPLPNIVLPPSFDCDNPTYRYRFLEPTSTILSRPVLDAHGWDHDYGYDGVSMEETLAILDRFSANVAVQVTKDKKEFTIHMDSSIAAKHGENASSLAGFDIKTVGRQPVYILHGETKIIKNIKKNETTGGFSVTFLGDTVATGLKVEDQLSLGKRLSLVASIGAMQVQGDTAYGANLEACLNGKHYPIGQSRSTLGLSLMKWRRDLALGANLQSQFSIARGSKMALRLGLNDKLSGQITVRTSTSDQVQIALLGLVSVAASIYKSFRPSEPSSI